MRVLHILLHHVDFILGDGLDVVRDEDTLPLTHAVGLDDHWKLSLLL